MPTIYFALNYVLYRGPSLNEPVEVWDPQAGAWRRYAGEDLSAEPWNELDEGEFEAMQYALTAPLGPVFIENEGALFRGYARGGPTHVWHGKAKGWVPYWRKMPKDISWGTVISEAEAKEMMAEDE